MLDFNKIVKKLWKKCWKILNKNDIFELIDPERKKIYDSKVSKIIYKWKNEKKIISIRNWIYIIPYKEDLELNEIDLIEKYYFKVLKKFISENCKNNYFISWKKSLEFQMKDFSIPEKIFITNRSLDKKIKIWNYEIIFKKISWVIRWKKTNLYARLSKHTKTIKIEEINLKISNLELSLLETSLISNIEEGLEIWLLNKSIKKYSKVLDKKVFEEIAGYKYIMSFNRLKELSRNINPELSRFFLETIKKNWGLFIWEGLRGV